MKIVRPGKRATVVAVLAVLCAVASFYTVLSGGLFTDSSPDAEAGRRATPQPATTAPEAPGTGDAGAIDTAGGERVALGSGDAAVTEPDEGDSPACVLLLATLDERSGVPVPEATVEFAPARDGEARRLHATDGSGRLTLEVAPGKVTLVAWKDHLVATPLRAVLEPGRNEIVLSLRRGAAVVGRVTDHATALPVEGAVISVRTVAKLDRVRSGADGRYTFPRFLVDGTYHQVRFEAAGYGAEVRYLRIDEDGSWFSPALFPGAPIESGVGSPARLDAALPASTELRGKIAGFDGAPIEGALATALGRFYIEADIAKSDRASAPTDASGVFSLPGLRSDVGHLLLLEAPGYARAHRTVPASSDPVQDLGTLYLEAQAVLGGVVTDPAGLPGEDMSVFLERPAPDASLQAFGDSPRDAGLATWLFRESARTDEAGAFLFESLGPGAHLLSVRRDMGVLKELEVEIRSGELRPDLEIALPPEWHTLFGEVSGPRGPAAGATVTLSRSGEIGTFTADSGGRFHVAGLDAAGGEYELTARWTDPETGARYEASARAGVFARPRIELQPVPDASAHGPGDP